MEVGKKRRLKKHSGIIIDVILENAQAPSFTRVAAVQAKLYENNLGAVTHLVRHHA